MPRVHTGARPAPAITRFAMPSTDVTALVSGTIDTPIGPIAVMEDADRALFMVEFADCRHRIDRWLQKRLDSGRYVRAPGFLSVGIRDIFGAYFDGDVSVLRDIPVRLDGTPFQNEVWSALRAIAPGQTFAYGAFAGLLGRPEAARAVGHANGANPLSIVVPCHRLVGSGGALTNYGGGLERKRWLLDHEARYAR